MKFPHLLLILSAILLFFIAGCSSREPLVAPSQNDFTTGTDSPLGHYQFVVDEDSGDVELIDRTSAYNMTGYFMIRLMKYEWDANLRIMYATVELESMIDMYVWGVRLVFSNTGGRWLINSDGYDAYSIGPGDPPLKRMPYLAYERDTYQREMTGADRREIAFHCPPGVTTIDFWIDGVDQWEREKPYVENQFCHKTLAISAWAVTAECYDYQTHHMETWPRGLNDLRVWADLSRVGGSYEEPMYDDGMHFDFEEGDHIYGIDFVPDPMVNFAFITIYCEDSDGNLAQNDVAFIREFTLRDYPLNTIEKGMQSMLEGPHYEIIRNQDRWTQFWREHKDDPTVVPPYINFESDMVLVAINGMAGAGETLQIDRVFQNTKRKLEIQLSRWNGSKGCILPYLATNAFHIASIDKCNLIPDPKFRNRLFYCDEQLPIQLVVSGKFSEIRSWREELILDQTAWESLWDEHTGGTSQPPEIDFDLYSVAAVFLGDRYYDDTYVEFNRVMDFEANMREIYYTEHYPGYGCELYPLDCQPFAIIMFEKRGDNYDWFYRSVPDDCI